MKRIVNGVTYNIGTSTPLARSTWKRDDGRVEAILYQTRGGAFFSHEEVSRNQWDQFEGKYVPKTEDRFVPHSPEEAHKWMLKSDVQVFTNPFDDPPEATAEAEPAATIYIRVPSSLKRRVDEAAAANKVSGNAWAMRCVERCLGPNEDAKEELATLHSILLHIRAYQGDGLTTGQVDGLLNEALEYFETAWGDLGFDEPENPSRHPDLDTRIAEHANTLTIERLNSKYHPSKEGG